MNKENQLNEAFKLITYLLTLLISASQLLFAIFPQNIQSFFLNYDVVGPVSMITFISIVLMCLAYYNDPYFRFLLPFQSDKKYMEYLNKINPNFNSPEEIKKVEYVKSPIYITASLLSVVLLPLVAIFGFVFVILGLNYKNSQNIPNSIVIWQALSYFLTLLFSVYVLFTHALKLIQRGTSNKNFKNRIDKAINLAKENNGFDNFPKIVFVSANETRDGININYTVTVKIEGKIYQITTDYNSEYLKSVTELVK